MRAMDKPTEYRQNAEYCRQMADAAHNQDEKTQWLRLAQSWPRMIHPYGHNPTGDEDAKL
jgi:hypothetical protein